MKPTNKLVPGFLSPATALPLLILALTVLGRPVPAHGDAKIDDRYRYILPGTATSDDPRQVPVPVRRRGSDSPLVLIGGRIFTATGEPAHEGTLVIEGNRITAVLPPGSQAWPANARIIDVSGRTVMPGLIDMHVHVTYPNADTLIDEQASEGAGVLRGLVNLRYFVENGITCVRDLGGVLNAPYLLAEWMADNRAPGPRLFVAGHIITGTGGHAAERPISANHSPAYTREADGPDDWRKAVRETFKQGASVIKVASYFSPEEIKAAVEEAHALGLRVTTHSETFYIEWAVDAGVDIVEHPLPRSDEAIRKMAEHHVAAIPTLQVYAGLYDAGGGYFNLASSGRFSMSKQQNFEMFKKLKAAGIVLGVGTDTIGPANNQTPNQYIGELKWFVRGGYTIPEALIAATRTNATLLGLGEKLGTLEPGKLADVIVVAGRPDENLDDLLRVETVVRDGIVMVEHGQVVVPRHVPLPLVTSSQKDGAR